MKNILALSTASLLMVLALGCGSGGSGGGGTTGSPTTPTGTTGGVGATVTLSATGVSNGTPRVALGERVQFTNNDTRAHEILTTPHLIHTDCPGINAIGMLTPGQSKSSEPLTTARGCGFHDHLNPDDAKFRGQVLVGLGSGDPIPPEPSYLH